MNRGQRRKARWRQYLAKEKQRIAREKAPAYYVTRIAHPHQSGIIQVLPDGTGTFPNILSVKISLAEMERLQKEFAEGKTKVELIGYGGLNGEPFTAVATSLCR